MSSLGVTKGEQSRARILQEAIRCVAAGGLAETSFQKIADHCGLTQSAVMHHFKNKKILVEAMLQKIVETNHAIVQSKLPAEGKPLEFLLAHFDGNFSWAKKKPEQASVIVLLYYYGSFEQEFAELYTRVRKVAVKTIQFYLPNKEARLAEAIHSFLLGSLLNLVATQQIQSTSRAKWVKHSKDFLQRVLSSGQVGASKSIR